ncbi:hypothetical protein [Sedimentibacter sp. B4]|uniref:hypothetical protein n=1 Tax=Sedimentibacter sp. B4 TaxID=304766 RepID=UPI0002F33A46|nr:hypothetical protein [Sedimentibacter sp. B4]
MYIKKLFKYVLLYGLVLGIGLLLLVLSTLIPRLSIQKKSEASAVYLNEQSLFTPILNGQKSTMVDNYADTISLSIAYSLDEKQPLKSALETNYYNEPTLNVNEAYKLSVMEQKKGNTPYTRYWHGSIIFIKILLMFLDIRGIRLLGAIVITGLIVGLSWLLYKNHHKILLLSFVIGMVFVGVWVVPFSIEYTSTFIIMMIFLIAIMLSEEKTIEQLFPAFFLIGSITCFFDFLTTETLTFTVPILFLLCLSFEKGELTDFKKGCILTLKSGVLWVLGYGIMWLSKWGISSLVLGRNTFIEAFEQAELRMIGEATGGGVQQLLGALFRNIALLFPMQFGKTYRQVFLLFIGIWFVLSCLWIFYGGKIKKQWFLKLLLLIGLIPYVRYVVLSNHSYLHYFFTYRAQLVSVIAVSYYFLFCLDKTLTFKFLKH